MKIKKRADQAKTISEVCGQPEGAFRQHLEEKTATLKGMDKRVSDRIRESKACDTAWAIA